MFPTHDWWQSFFLQKIFHCRGMLFHISVQTRSLCQMWPRDWESKDLNFDRLSITHRDSGSATWRGLARKARSPKVAQPEDKKKNYHKMSRRRDGRKKWREMKKGGFFIFLFLFHESWEGFIASWAKDPDWWRGWPRKKRSKVSEGGINPRAGC